MSSGGIRREAARRAKSVGHPEAARRLGVPVASLGNGARTPRAGGAAPPGAIAPVSRAKPSVLALEAENSRLCKELTRAKLDVEILSKNPAYFAKGAR
ncbi:transposase [Pandoraea sputorum]|uniref:Transposase n=1 Tax=Pandoraea sputorum TaxID=93222 RepID=A0A5E5BK00_9BURK|nr:transposase [Pandoraea sputorum]